MIIRKAVPSDAPAIAALTKELGYSATPEEVRGRLTRLLGLADHHIAVAVADGEVAGWLQATTAEVIESGFRAEIVGLVVSEKFRRLGIGRMLVEDALDWATAEGTTKLLVRSNVKRAESHIFYQALGFQLSKTQGVYKRLVGS
jgi:GNAT superfamily N-acetyltransferase